MIAEAVVPLKARVAELEAANAQLAAENSRLARLSPSSRKTPPR